MLLQCRLNFYPRPPRGGRPGFGCPRASSTNFYPRPPRGGRLLRVVAWMYLFKFLSTPSARRATSAPAWRCSPHSHFYPRPPRGGRLVLRGEHDAAVLISIHALREEGDVSGSVMTSLSGRFLSTPSARRATVASSSSTSVSKSISIHALREEGDSKNRDKSSIFKQIIQHSARI